MASVFISVLGTTDYVECNYISPDTDVTCLSRFVQEATVLMNCSGWAETDRILIFTTEDAEKRNWLDNGQTDRKTQQPRNQEGLYSRLKHLSLKPSIENIRIPEGKTIDEIWSIFNLILGRLNPSDEVIFDITHSFRSIPMLVMVILNYAKVTKRVALNGIYYGAMESLGNLSEVEKMPLLERKVPIFDLSAFDELLDWSVAVERFLESGDGNMVSRLASKKAKLIRKAKKAQDDGADAMARIAAAIETFSGAISTCRGKLINQSVKNLKHSIEVGKKSEIAPALVPLLDHLDERLQVFSGDAVDDGLRAVEWCVEHNLIQQGFTILREFMINYVCKGFNVDPSDQQERDRIENAIRKDVDTWKKDQQRKRKVKVTLDLIELPLDLFPQDSELLDMFNRLFGLRNDINHAGMRLDPKPAKTLRNELHELVSKMNRLILEKK